MSTDRDVTRIVRSWLDEGVTALPDRVLDAVLDQLPANPQRRTFWLARRLPPMNSTFRLGIAAAVVVIAAILGSSYINSQVGSDQPTPTPSPSATPVPLPSAGALAPGSYFLANSDPICAGGCSGYRWITFTLPAGWATSHGLVYKHLNQPGEVAFSAWTVDQVYADPCHWQGSALSPLELANHSHDATGAIILAPEDGGLANQALRGPLPRALTPVTLASVWSGVSGRVMVLRIDLSVPTELDVSTCDKGEFRSWTEWHVADGANSHHAPSQLDTVYMVDVDRRPLVIDASHMPATSEEDLAELEAILASMIIDRG